MLGIAGIIGGILLTMILLYCLYKRKISKNKIHNCPLITNSSENKSTTLKDSVPVAKPYKSKKHIGIKGRPADYIIEKLDKSFPAPSAPPLKLPKLKRTKKFRLKAPNNTGNLDNSTPKTVKKTPHSSEDKTNIEN